MAHKKDCTDCTGAGASRRDVLKASMFGLIGGLAGLSLPNKLFLERAYGIQPVAPLYDAVIQIFFEGGPSQTDTWDPKAGSANNVFPAIDTGFKDIYGNKMMVSNVFPNLVKLIQNDKNVGLGIVRSMTHGNGDHGIAEGYMNCFWQSPLASIYPSTAAVFSYYFADNCLLGIPSVVINGSNGVDVNNGKGANITTALQVSVGQGQGNNPTVAALSLPTGVDAARYARRKAMIDQINAGISGSRPDQTVASYKKAYNDAYTITTQGQAAKAFDLTGKTILPGTTIKDLNGQSQGPDNQTLQAMTLAQELVKAGIPYVACGIGGNDTHSGNIGNVTQNWGSTIDPALSALAVNLEKSGKRVLVVMGGEFGRTPDSVAGGRDGRDHYPDGFSWALLSINQPKFKTTAVGDTGVDGLDSVGNNKIKDAVYPGTLGGMIYEAMGFPTGSDPKWDVPTSVRMAPAVDRTMALTDSPVLAKHFGLA